MSATKQINLHNKDLLVTYIKCENNTMDDIVYDKSTELHGGKNNPSNALLASAYKGKIEVTSKGRRKIFDGVRWQILCRRPECRKQTNKKSLCITHYKEEYESNNQSSWSNNLSSFRFPAYRQRQSFDNTKTRIEHEDQNNTISTTNISDNDEHVLTQSDKKSHVSEGQIEYMTDGRRFVFKNSKWLPLCKYNSFCCNTAKRDLLCMKHFELTQEKRREAFNFHSDDIIKRLKTNNGFHITSSCITKQFNINSDGDDYTTNKKLNGSFSMVASKPVGPDIGISMRKILNTQQSDLKNDQSVQTDLTIPLCCIIHNEDHSIYSSCQKNLRKFN